MRDRTMHRMGWMAPSLLALCLSAYGQGGMGISLGTAAGDPDGAPIAVAVAPGSPAAAAGIEPGDRIVKLGSVALAAFAVSDAESLLNNPDQAIETLTVQKRTARDLTIVRLSTASAAGSGLGTKLNNLSTGEGNATGENPPDETQAQPANNPGIAHWTDDPQGAAAQTATDGQSPALSAEVQQEIEKNAQIMRLQQDPSWQPDVNALQANAGDLQQYNPAPPATKKQKFMNFLNGMANAAAAASGASVAGDWVSYEMTIRRVDAMFISPLTFTAQLHLDANGTYVYQVQQSEGMPWTMTVQGTYSATPLGGNAMELDLMPSASNAGEISGENLSVLAYAGFPAAAPHSFTFTMDAKGAAVQPYPRPRSSTQVYFRRAF